MELTAHSSLCPLVRFLERQVLFNHELQHEQQMSFGMMFFMPKQGIRLSFCEQFIDHGFLDQLCDCHFTWKAISW